MWFSIFIWMIVLYADGRVQGRGWRDGTGRAIMLEHYWALINLCINNLILLRNGQNNMRFLCIKVDLYV